METDFDKALEDALISRLCSGFCEIIATTEGKNLCFGGANLQRCRLALVKAFIYFQLSLHICHNFQDQRGYHCIPEMLI